jgi:hypothetical protein
MIRFLSALLVMLSVLALSVSAMAQEDLGSKSERLKLAKQMNDIRPARAQVDEAVQAVSRNLGPMEKERLLKLVARAFDYKALEAKSIETTAELFSVAELQKMVDYFGSPEAKAVATKLSKYQDVMQPIIIEMLDKALMVEKTGGPADRVETVPPAVDDTVKP